MRTLIDATSEVRGLVRLADAESTDAPKLHRVQTAADLAERLAAAVRELEARASGRATGETLPSG